MKHLEEDAANIMSYMASNGLEANQYKKLQRALTLLNQESKSSAEHWKFNTK